MHQLSILLARSSWDPGKGPEEAEDGAGSSSMNTCPGYFLLGGGGCVGSSQAEEFPCSTTET